MTQESSSRHSVAVIGAGPAGLFAARELAGRGIFTVLLNRDIKPGGLAEYGIYPGKLRMKEGLRNQFHQILSQDGLYYFGNVLVGEHADLTLDDLRRVGFDALLVTVGAQSTKRLGLPGENLPGVYHAKDIVYHYNALPPFSETTYQIGKRVAVVGAGNVMMDITHWLIDEKKVDQVIAVARRGPGEVKFDKKELENIVGCLDQNALAVELERILPRMQAVNQNADSFLALIAEASKKAAPVEREGCFFLRFLASPSRILSSDQGQVAGLLVEETQLVLGEDGEVRAKGTGQFSTLDVDTVIFAIGDVVDSAIGLPVQWGEYAKNPDPRFPVEGQSYEAYDPAPQQPIADVFLAGWARRPSTGLVGVARKDGANAAQVVSQYLQTVSPSGMPVEARLRECLTQLSHPVVDKRGLFLLEEAERENARERGLPAFKFSTNKEMLEVLARVSFA